MPINGVDVSQWQGVIDWTVMTKQARFAFIRASYGIYPDSRSHYNWLYARAAGIPRGAYHYYYRDVSPVAQAKAFIDALASDYGELPCVCDVEDTAIPNAPWTQVQCDNLRAWLGIVEAAVHRSPIIYTGAWYWTPQMKLAPWASGYDLWIAQYGVQTPGVPPPWATYKFWQFSDTGIGEDYGTTSDTIDLDTFNGTEAEWTEYISQGKNPK